MNEGRSVQQMIMKIAQLRLWLRLLCCLNLQVVLGEDSKLPFARSLTKCFPVDQKEHARALYIHGLLCRILVVIKAGWQPVITILTILASCIAASAAERPACCTLYQGYQSSCTGTIKRDALCYPFSAAVNQEAAPCLRALPRASIGTGMLDGGFRAGTAGAGGSESLLMSSSLLAPASSCTCRCKSMCCSSPLCFISAHNRHAARVQQHL